MKQMNNEDELNEETTLQYEVRMLFDITQYPKNWDEFINELKDAGITYKIKKNTSYRLNNLGVEFILIGPKDVITEFINKHSLVTRKPQNTDKFKLGDKVMTPEGIGEVAGNYGKMYGQQDDYYLVSFRNRYTLHKETDLRKLYQ